MDIGDMIGHGFEAMGAVGIAAVGWLTRNHEKQIEAQKERMKDVEKNVRDGVSMHMQLKDSFYKYQLEAKDNFADEKTIQFSLARLYDALGDHSNKTDEKTNRTEEKLDRLNEKIDQNFRELMKAIKS